MIKNEKSSSFRISLMVYDLIIFAALDISLLGFYRGGGVLGFGAFLLQSLIGLVCIFASRIGLLVYKQIWRYGGVQCFIRLIIADAVSCLVFLVIEKLLPTPNSDMIKLLAFCCMDSLAALVIRLVYRYAYKCGSANTRQGRFLRWLLKIASFGSVETEPDPNSQKIKIAIVGAGVVGVDLAEDLIHNPKSQYVARCFIDIDPLKTGRAVHNLDVLPATQDTLDALKKHHIQEVVFAVPNMDSDRKRKLYDIYQGAGFRIKIYDYPSMDVPGQKRELRPFDIADLLFRSEKEVLSDATKSYYRGKTILITGGGGSIGSEICRQLAKMEPKQLVVLDVYENTAYDLQQQLKMAYQDRLKINVEIASICDKKALNRVFEEYHPDICINAAAHKHVPLMEKNCIEAVQNNVFGCLNVINCCEEYGCGRFLMVSTDKAVNPTNVMGATKRVCEMIMQAYSTRGKVICSATRFGNVLGSAGSVIPLFRRQIAAGGPVTVTDRRIIRYFMTIPEASQLVLTSGAMAHNGDLFVLDMGEPVKIWDLAKNMIALSGVQGVDIVETGLRPGEKLYEELLVKSDDLEKTENDLIFIEHESPVTIAELEVKLRLLRDACTAGSDAGVKKAMHTAVPTFKDPDEVNVHAIAELSARSRAKA